MSAYVATRTFREHVLGDTSGAGTAGLDDEHAAASFEGIGAEIMGAGMFGLHAHPGDPDWQGWWGPDPPFGVPVFVLTHEQRPTLEMKGGTTFHFVQTAPEETLALAIASSAGGRLRQVVVIFTTECRIILAVVTPLWCERSAPHECTR